MFNPTSMNLFNPFGIVEMPKAQLKKIVTDFGMISPVTGSRGIEFFTPEWLDVGIDEAYKFYDKSFDEPELVDEEFSEDLQWAIWEFECLVDWKWSYPWDE
jgi:hypothetical protein